MELELENPWMRAQTARQAMNGPSQRNYGFCTDALGGNDEVFTLSGGGCRPMKGPPDNLRMDVLVQGRG